MLDKIFKEEGQQIAGPILYEKILEELSRDKILEQLRQLPIIERRQLDLQQLVGIALKRWKSLIGVRITDSSVVEYIGEGDPYTPSTKSLFSLTYDFYIKPSRTRGNDPTIYVHHIQCLTPPPSVKDREIGFRNVFKAPLDTVKFEFIPIQKYCKKDNENLLDDFIIDMYNKYLDDLIDPPKDAVKRFFPVIYKTEDKKQFLEMYKHHNTQGILDYLVSKKTADPSTEELRTIINEKIS